MGQALPPQTKTGTFPQKKKKRTKSKKERILAPVWVSNKKCKVVEQKNARWSSKSKKKTKDSRAEKCKAVELKLKKMQGG
jgi:hypothetical protein